MLSETAKARFSKTCSVFREIGLGEWLIEQGPVKLVNATIDCPIPNHPDQINMRDNREEAERFVAGLLGMM